LALLETFRLFKLFGLFLAYFGLFWHFLFFFYFIFFASYGFWGYFWLFLALLGTLQLFVALSIETICCLPPSRIVLWMWSWQQESEVRLCKYEGPGENQCHNCWPRQIGSIQEDLREGLDYWE
jgi:hypothetical protein